jgi:hypothetical protein
MSRDHAEGPDERRSCAGGRDEKAAVGDGGRGGESDVARERGNGLVRAEPAGELHDVRGRRDSLEIELGDASDVVEHRGELARHRLDLAVVEPQARKARDVENLGAIDHGEGL